MGLFGKSFEEKVEDALNEIRSKGLNIKNLGAKIEAEVVTLTGEAGSAEVRAQVMQAFDDLVKTENTLNQMRVERPTAPMPEAMVAEVAQAVARATPAGRAGERWHEVVSGDTLSALAQKYYGKAGQYMKIFEANRDQLDDPNKIQAGQKPRIPQEPLE